MKKILTVAATVVLCMLLVVFIYIRVDLKTSMPVGTDTAEAGDKPDAEYFTFNFVGDNTLEGREFENLSKGSADYPYANTRQYLACAEFNFANLECNFSDNPSLYSSSMFHFKAPTKNVYVLTHAGIDFVTTANNHTMDYGQKGFDDTVATLERADIAYGIDGENAIFTTENGIKIGIYCGFKFVSEDHVVACIEKLQKLHVDYIICAFHWGAEGAYRPSATQTALAHACIDAGADIVYGSHPHVLQPVEEYNGGFIMYSLGNWCFGGNSHPSDMDSALIQVTVRRDTDGSVSTDSYKLIPCCFSSVSNRNDYCPTPYKKGTPEYDRAMSKLLGTFTGANLVIDYSNMKPQETEAPAETALPGDTVISGETSVPEATSIPEVTSAPEVPDSPPEAEAATVPTE